MGRDWNHPETDIDVTVVKRGVDLSLTQDEKTIVCELTQDQAIDLAHAIMWRAGCRLIRHTKGGDIQFEFIYPHPFEKTTHGLSLRSMCLHSTSHAFLAHAKCVTNMQYST